MKEESWLKYYAPPSSNTVKTLIRNTNDAFNEKLNGISGSINRLDTSTESLKEVIEKVKAAGNPPLFSEPQYENAALRTVAQETGAPVYELDPLVTGDGAKTAYEDVMRKNLQVLLEALGN